MIEVRNRFNDLGMAFKATLPALGAYAEAARTRRDPRQELEDDWTALFKAGTVKCTAEVVSEWRSGGQPCPPGRLWGQTARQYRASRRAYGRDLRAWKRAGSPPPRWHRLVWLRMEARTFDGRRVGYQQHVPEEVIADEPLLRAVLDRMRRQMVQYVVDDGKERPTLADVAAAAGAR
jgi:hypothetical protein